MATLSSIITPSNVTTATNTQTLTNKTITGGILNGTLGATTPSTVAATTITATGAITSTVANNVLTLRSSVGNATNKISFGTTSGEWSLINYSDTTGYLSIGQPAGRSYGVNIQTNGANVGVFTATGLAVTGEVSATGDVFLNRAAGTNRLIWFQSGGSNRWAIYATATAESGSNAGTHFAIARIADDGTTVLGNALVINRDTGNAIFSGAVSIGTTGTTCAGSNVLGLNIDNDLTSSLGIGINTSSASGTQYFMGFGRAGSICGQIYSTGTNSTTYATSSDYRLKNVIGKITNSGEFIDALKPIEGTWKSDNSKFVGFLAHEFAEVSPSSVGGEKDAVDADGKPVYQSMQASSGEVIANIVAELQSLRKRLAAIESK